jgi:hypothetical protein
VAADTFTLFLYVVGYLTLFAALPSRTSSSYGILHQHGSFSVCLVYLHGTLPGSCLEGGRRRKKEPQYRRMSSSITMHFTSACARRLGGENNPLNNTTLNGPPLARIPANDLPKTSSLQNRNATNFGTSPCRQPRRPVATSPFQARRQDILKPYFVYILALPKRAIIPKATRRQSSQERKVIS